MIEYKFLVLLFIICAGSGMIYLIPCAVTLQQPISRNSAYCGGIAHANSTVALVLAIYALSFASDLAVSDAL